MLIAVIMMSIICVLLFILLLYSVRRNLEFDTRFIEMGDQVEQSLDIIDECYRRVSIVAETPVASDDPMVQQLISDIKYTKQAILLVANKIVTFDKVEDDEE